MCRKLPSALLARSTAQQPQQTSLPTGNLLGPTLFKSILPHHTRSSIGRSSICSSIRRTLHCGLCCHILIYPSCFRSWKLLCGAGHQRRRIPAKLPWGRCTPTSKGQLASGVATNSRLQGVSHPRSASIECPRQLQKSIIHLHKRTNLSCMLNSYPPPRA